MRCNHVLHGRSCFPKSPSDVACCEVVKVLSHVATMCCVAKVVFRNFFPQLQSCEVVQWFAEIAIMCCVAEVVSRSFFQKLQS